LYGISLYPCVLNLRLFVSEPVGDWIPTTNGLKCKSPFLRL